MFGLLPWNAERRPWASVAYQLFARAVMLVAILAFIVTHLGCRITVPSHHTEEPGVSARTVEDVAVRMVDRTVERSGGRSDGRSVGLAVGSAGRPGVRPFWRSAGRFVGTQMSKSGVFRQSAHAVFVVPLLALALFLEVASRCGRARPCVCSRPPQRALQPQKLVVPSTHEICVIQLRALSFRTTALSLGRLWANSSFNLQGFGAHLHRLEK